MYVVILQTGNMANPFSPFNFATLPWQCLMLTITRRPPRLRLDEQKMN